MTDREQQLQDVLSASGVTIREIKTLPNLLNQVAVRVSQCNLGPDDFQIFIDAGLKVFERPEDIRYYDMTFSAERPKPKDPVRVTEQQLRKAEEATRSASAAADEAHTILTNLLHA